MEVLLGEILGCQDYVLDLQTFPVSHKLDSGPFQHHSCMIGLPMEATGSL